MKKDRRKFLFAGISLAAVWAALRFGSKPEPRKTMKFLTQDGKLVELDIDKIPAAKRVATKSDIQNWIKK
jgi:hypothetical protein